MIVKKKIKSWIAFVTLTLFSIACQNQNEIEKQFWNPESNDPSDTTLGTLIGNSLSSEDNSSGGGFLAKPNYGIKGSWRMIEGRHQDRLLFEDGQNSPLLEIQDHSGTITLSPSTYTLRAIPGCLLTFPVNLEFAGDVADVKIVKSDSALNYSSDCKSLTFAEIEEEQRIFESTFLSHYDYELNFDGGVLILLDKDRGEFGNRRFQLSREIDPEKGTVVKSTSKSKGTKKSSKNSSRSNSTKKALSTAKNIQNYPETKSIVRKNAEPQKTPLATVDQRQNSKDSTTEGPSSQKKHHRSAKPIRIKTFVNKVILKMLEQSQHSFLQKNPEQAGAVLELQSRIRRRLMRSKAVTAAPPPPDLTTVSILLAQISHSAKQKQLKEPLKASDPSPKSLSAETH